jgi:hypothetical protein
MQKAFSADSRHSLPPLGGYPQRRAPPRRRAVSSCSGFTMREVLLLGAVLLLSGIVCLTSFTRSSDGRLPASGHAALADARRIDLVVPHHRRLRHGGACHTPVVTDAMVLVVPACPCQMSEAGRIAASWHMHKHVTVAP